MTDLEIKEEAKRRYAELPEEEKLSVWCPALTQEDRAFLDHVEEIGYKQLSEKEKNNFAVLTFRASNKNLPGGMIKYGVMKHMEEKYNISREDLANGAKNPFRREFLLCLLLGLGVAFVGALVAVLAAKAGAAAGKTAGIVIAAIGGILAMRASSVVSAIFDFKKIQKMAVSGELDEEYIKREIYNLVDEEMRKRWYGEEAL
jgi:hypothetical protein